MKEHRAFLAPRLLGLFPGQRQRCETMKAVAFHVKSSGLCLSFYEEILSADSDFGKFNLKALESIE